MISKKECIKKIHTLITQHSYSKLDSYLFEIYINIYLLLSKKRKLAQIYIYHHISKIKNLLTRIYPYFIYEKERSIILLHTPKYNVHKMNRTFSKKYAQDLGPFYVCAGNLEKIYKKYKYLLRPVIEISCKNKYGNSMAFELYAQMCPITVCIKNLQLFYKIQKKLRRDLKKISQEIYVDFTIHTYGK